MNSKSVLLWVVIGLVIIIGAVVILMPSADEIESDNPDLGQVQTKSYENEAYGLSFMYPSTYEINEREVGDAHRGHYSIAVLENVAIPENGEGPTAITLDIFQNNLDRQTVSDWIKNSNNSNYKLSHDILATTTIAGKEGLSYTWDGLYRGESVVFEHKDSIIMLSVTSLTPEDKIRKDFETVLSTLKLD
jgi:hypothetical protein